ncbi:crotonyl-CoA carboxylase/reductase [Bradyrhizobium centrolobii]|uniref:Crotonyl-CoA carboxylase/reductase n=1 Tax=Bradyrhizobium centrolobii TaxID=1505087 RepID=A0A176YXB8_9BRAD|nr:crotonyl-CoA carboxylase/reductase [Bradyrhizobium centrolobii]OAF12342.1 crotonyl-CoA carboxylase/reductase [Bradyrhizobium centrolobii]
MTNTSQSEKDLYDLGEKPPLGVVPKSMHAFAIRQSRYGEPNQSLRREVINTPQIGADEVLVYVMATGINYNNVWAALGFPIDVIAERQKSLSHVEDFHVGGSDCSGIVWAVGQNVKNVKPGDEVVVHSGWWPSDDPWVISGNDPMLAETARVWGYQTNYGSFGQFSVAKAHQCLPRPKHLTWEASGCYLLCASTAYRMLMGWAPHTVEKGDVVLVWGAAGGLGSMAIQICRVKGAKPVAVISGEEKREFCLKLGAVGVIDRTKFDHWGQLPDTNDADAYGRWLKGARAFGKAIWDAAGSRTSPRIVFEHPAETTLPTSNFVCSTGGMVVICAGTTGYNATLDVRYHWMRQKRFQGSHVCNTEQAKDVNDLVRAREIDPCLSRTFSFDEIGVAHQLMRENKHPFGNMACLVNATAPGHGATA